MLRFPCPCCGYLVFGEPPGSYDICKICFWEDDALQLEYATTLAGGANHTTLQEAQQNFADIGVCEERCVDYVRSPTDIDSRDPEWRPIDLSLDRFEIWGNSEGERPHSHEESLYYWRPTYWQRNRDV
jgi:hypothetical protein